MKVAFFEVKEWEREYLAKQLSGVEVSFFAEALTEKTVLVARDFDIISVFVDSQVNAKSLAGFNHLKMIATRSTGFDHVDMDFCRKNNITVCNVPFYGENTVAEHTFALLLDLSRKIHQSVARVKHEGFSVEGLTGFDLKGRTIGIVGLGHIGQHVARIAKGFEMNVVACDAKQDKKLAKQLGLTYVSLEDLLKVSDIITLHVPHNEKTHHLINSQNIGLIKTGAYLINTARGGIVETDALVCALENGTLAGAGLDVLEEEAVIKEEAHFLSKDFPPGANLRTLLENHVLMEKENVIITPHNAFNSKEALERILETTVENVVAFTKGKSVNVV